MKNLLKLSDFDTNYINKLLDKAELCSQGVYDNSCDKKIMINCFFEPSTRTHYSFQVAEHRLGCKVINFYPEDSSILKGETFYDTIMVFDSYNPDGIVIRSKENGYYNSLIGKVHCPIFNGGDGTQDHPTQSLLDLLTIRQEFNKFDGLKIAIVGDIKHSRVAHTNIEVMQRLNMDCYISGPEEFRDSRYNYINFETALKEMDIIMLLRVQHERHKTKMSKTVEEYHEKYGLTLDRVKMMKPNAIIMHPALFNREVEIASNVVECEKSRIFKQMTNGVYVRMAVIHEAIMGE